MLHPDEGVIHELLDGELGPEDTEAVRRHIAECGDCLRLYEEARELAAVTDRVIASLDDTRAELNEGFDGMEPIPAPPAANVGAGAPVVLMPSAPVAPKWRRTQPRGGLWAAVLLLVLGGGGYLLLRDGGHENAPPAALPALAALPAESVPPPSADSIADAAAEARAQAALASRPPLGTAALDSVRADTSRQASRDTARDTTRSARRDTANARTQPRDTAPQLAAAARRERQAEPAALTKSLASNAAPAPTLDRAQPRADRAAAAADRSTRDIPAESVAPPRVAAAPASPPTLDVQAQITSRIGLDDAKRELGTPLHAIEGLRPRLVGLVPGRLVPGADPSRNVVRAVYLDANGQPFYLDQQRVGASGPRRAGGIVKGDVQLFLNGNVPPDSAQSLAQRLR
jgi:anti-sigma factor RsiW